MAVLDQARADRAPTSLPALSPPLCHGSWPMLYQSQFRIARTTSTQICPGAGLEKSSRGSPDHPSIHAGCRFPWKPVRSRILLQGLPEEILEGHLTMQPFLSPKDRRARKRHRRLTAPTGPGGTQSYPTAPRCPAHLGPASPPPPPGSQPAASLYIKNTETQ